MRRRWSRWVAAAVLVFVVCSLWFVVSRKSEVGSQKSEMATTHDVPAPKETRAVITLADGSKVYLDSVSNGTIAQQNNVNVVKNNNGEIVYSPDHQITKSPITYNTLFNPRGSKVISLTLSDGTKVWLNSESSLRYPASFAATALNREVEITGEAYFEVKHNARQPFKVHLPNGSVVEDIGTAFNINAYTDEDDIKTTLVEGSVRVFANSQKLTANSQILKPGEQSVQIRNIPVIRVQNNVDLDEAVAWKNGRFEFGGGDLSSVMRQLSRWYDVEIVYEGEKPTANFRGTISRQESISNVLKMLELTKAVKFRVEGKTIIVTK